MSDFAWTDAGVRTALGLRAELAEVGVEYEGVSTDSRSVADGDLYVALVGDHFDGHDFVVDAFAKGARAAVVSRSVPGDPLGRLYPVPDTLVALGGLAAHRRRGLKVPVVAITGSSGKTTTKDNRIGMPMTLLAVPDDTEAVVLELGTNEPGEITALAQIARPDIAVITTVGESHLEKLGTFEGVLDEKLALLHHLSEGGRCVVGDEPAELADRARELCSSVRVVGWSERADDQGRPLDADVDVFGRYAFTWRGQKTTMPMIGRHAVSNALIALTVSDLLGVSARDAIRGLASAEIGSMRGEFQRIGDLTVIVDCYNANPQSVRASLDVLQGQGVATQRVAVLGTMLELGDGTDALHVETLRDALTRDLDLVVATGAFADAAATLKEHLGGGAEEPRVLTAPSWREAYPALRAELTGDEVVLLKASRGIALEGILPMLSADFGSDAVEV